MGAEERYHRGGQRILIIGGGLAGLAAAVYLAPRCRDITLLEARSRLGGRAGSFVDQASGQLLDACQHVTMGCCTAFASFCQRLGIDSLLRRQSALHFMTPDGQTSRWQADPWPAPWHLARTLALAHFLSAREKTQAALAMLALRRLSPDHDEPLLPWLLHQGQTPRLLDRFWSPVLVSALNDSLDRLGTKYARKVFVDAFLASGSGGDVYLPTVPLDRLYGEELAAWLQAHRVRVRTEVAVRQLLVDRDAWVGAELRDGQVLEADACIAAVPWHRFLDSLPEELVEAEETFEQLRLLEAVPITSVHLWYDQPLTPLPHVVLLESICQWLFRKGETAPGEHYHQVVISAARVLRDLGHEETLRRTTEELSRLFPGPKLLRARVVTEPRATFSASPGVDRLRPLQKSPIRGLFLAGDWTQTGWPATMEGAVRSGILAGKAVLRPG